MSRNLTIIVEILKYTKINTSIWVNADSCPVQSESLLVCFNFNIDPKFVAIVNHFKPELNGEN